MNSRPQTAGTRQSMARVRGSWFGLGMMLLLAAAIASAAPARPEAAAAPAAAGSVEEIRLTIGRAHVLNSGAVRRIALGNGKVVQATALDSKQILLLPEAVGQSSLHVWPRHGSMRRYLITVLGDTAARRYEAVRQMLGGAGNLSARLAGDAVIIDGHDLSAAQAARIQAITARFPDVLDLATGAGSERMIAMDVKFVEIKKSALKRLGVRWSGTASGPSFGIIGDLRRSDALARDSLANAIGQHTGAAVTPFASALSLATSISSMLDFLVQNGQASVLAEPRLSCRSGGSAKFIAGGELPIPMSGGLGTVSVSFKEYGIKFDFSPTAMPGGLVAARIATEVSSVDFEVQVKEVPGIIKRRAETEVQLQENQTMVIAGLLTEETTRHVDKVAGLGDIPILGHLFRSREFRSNQTDLAVFVTPRFVDNRATAGSAQPPGPSQQTRAATAVGEAGAQSTPVTAPAVQVRDLHDRGMRAVQDSTIGQDGARPDGRVPLARTPVAMPGHLSAAVHPAPPAPPASAPATQEPMGRLRWLE
ncbi:MAG: pilus assembly protein N-terminal domain-containing protein [Burkholderiaceae bacterium]